MYTALSLLCLICACATVYGQTVTVQAVAGWNPATAEFRRLTAVSSPDGFIVTGVKAKVQDQTATVDAAKFAVGNGQTLTAKNPPGFYLGVLDAKANIDTSGNTWSGSVTGSFAEVMAGFNTIMAYYEGNNQPGFQYALGSDPTQGCDNSSNTVDCVFAGDVYQLKDLSWSNVQHVETPCTSVDATCKVHSFYMTGSTTGFNSVQVVKLNFTVTTHPVIVSTAGGFSVEINPDKGKIDVDITFPWSKKTATTRTDSPHVALIVYAAGKAGTGAAAFAANARTVSWVGASGKLTSFDWDGSAKVAGTSQNVIYQRTTGAEIEAYAGVTVGVFGAAFLAGLKFSVGVFKAFGWATEMVIFSWAADQPDLVSWDPSIGSSSTPGTTSDSTVFGVSVVLMFLVFFYHRFF